MCLDKASQKAYLAWAFRRGEMARRPTRPLGGTGKPVEQPMASYWSWSGDGVAADIQRAIEQRERLLRELRSGGC